MNIFVGVTGASGQIYAGRLIQALAGLDHNVTVCLSDASVEVVRSEDSAFADLIAASRDEITGEFLKHHGVSPGDVNVVLPDNISSIYASGSALADAAIICPCSMSSLACMAAGITRNLIHRAADVMLKESRPLVIVPRETPLSEIHLKNMLTLKRAGAQIVPAMPAFYHQPQTIDDLVSFVAGKTLDTLKIPHEIFARWKG